jgi:hypothetical protein
MVLSGGLFTSAVEDATLGIYTTVDEDCSPPDCDPDLDCWIIPFFITNSRYSTSSLLFPSTKLPSRK